MTAFPSLSKFVDEMLLPSGYYYNLATNSSEQKNYYRLAMNASEHAIKQLRSFYNSAIFGNNKMFKPRWRQETAITNYTIVDMTIDYANKEDVNSIIIGTTALAGFAKLKELGNAARNGVGK
jgi:hypothetical protein